MDNVYRFAPSPSGYLHVGGARTAIFNWLLAQQTGGKFILRIEDTDQKRSTEESVTQILKSLHWLGLTWDGEPYFQSRHISRYLDIINELLEKQRAYRCFCSRTEVDGKRMSRYNGPCRTLSSEDISIKLSSGVPYSVRIKIPEGITTYEDLIHGSITIDNKEVDDFIILRSDNTPVYNLAVTVDDHDMGVTHIIRGDDHIANTPRQIHLYKALEWSIPEFGHLPLILGADRKRLSKRHGATSVEEFRSVGIFPDALVNYLCLLGWSPGDDREIFSRRDLINRFSLERVKSANAVFDIEKMLWMNGKYISTLSLEKLLTLVKRNSNLPIDVKEQSILHIGTLVKERVRTLNEFADGIRFLYEDPQSYEETGIRKYFSKGNPHTLLQGLKVLLEKESDFSVDCLESTVRSFAQKCDVSAAKIIHPLRLALTGKTTSPGIFDVMYALGENKVIYRIESAVSFIDSINLNTEEEHH